MNKILLIIKREYLTRVKKKSFLIMTIVGPLLMAALFIVPILMINMDDKDEKIIVIYDKSNEYKEVFHDEGNLKFNFVSSAKPDSIKKGFADSGYYAYLEIPASTKNEKINLYSDKQANITVKKYIERTISEHIETAKLKARGIDKAVIDSIKTKVSINTIKWTDSGEVQSSTEITMVIGFIAAIIIYMFIFMYGSQVMRGVIEEKTSRIVEVIISSIKPFELMAGKIIGIALVAITQFVLWGVLSTAIIMPLQMFVVGDASQVSEQIQSTDANSANLKQFEEIANSNNISQIMNTLSDFDWGTMLFAFVFFFITGYLLYASLFAAIGSAVDNETDTQQFMMPVTVPLILAFISAQAIIKDPDGAIAFWFSIVPFTSPIIMPIRVAFGSYEIWEMLLSMFLIIITFIGTTWFASKIYRVGILMYGKKVSYKELWKWIRYK